MRVTPSALPEVLLIEPDVHRDARGFFVETYHSDRYRAIGIIGPFVQDNHSKSCRNAVRGLHLQVGKHPQGKLVRVVHGEIYDVAVDVRRGSPSFGRWVAVKLSGTNFLQIYIPPGFAHGFAVTSTSAEVEYKCTDIYDPASEIGVLWNDPELGIKWPVSDPTLSARDRVHPRLSEQLDRLPSYAKD